MVNKVGHKVAAADIRHDDSRLNSITIAQHQRRPRQGMHLSFNSLNVF